MIDRKQPPPYKTIEDIRVVRANGRKLDNGIDLFTVSAGSQEISRIEFIFRAGMYHQPATLVASMTNSMLESGTKSFTANELSDGIDFYGSFMEVEVDQDHATVTLFSLNKYLAESLRFIEEMLKCPVFPEQEFRILLANKRQKHAINSQKVSVVARRRFTRLLFGATHPYGVEVADSDYDRVSLSEIRQFYNERYGSRNCTIVAAGKLPEDLFSTLNGLFGRTEWGGATGLPEVNIPAYGEIHTRHLVQKDDAIQSAIRVGRLLFNKTHPDYFGFQVLNTVLGGYFGSRLMANIREDKGYTYGIGSGVSNLTHNGYFFISTEVAVDVTRATLDEIYSELEKLRAEPVGREELETVRNYMLGNFLRSVDGPFSLADKFKGIWQYGLDYAYYDRYFAAVKNATPEQLQELANKYLHPESMVECVAGRMQ